MRQDSATKIRQKSKNNGKQRKMQKNKKKSGGNWPIGPTKNHPYIQPLISLQNASDPRGYKKFNAPYSLSILQLDSLNKIFIIDLRENSVENSLLIKRGKIVVEFVIIG